ncbi:hypothetical protein BDW75DRAFT_198637 [Aspergillus navahoensis]
MFNLRISPENRGVSSTTKSSRILLLTHLIHSQAAYRRYTLILRTVFLYCLGISLTAVVLGCHMRLATTISSKRGMSLA